MGRPSKFAQKIADAICERIAEGEPLRQICRDSGMPNWRTVYDWLDAHPEFSARFARARDLGFDAIAEEALEIADTPLKGVRREKDKFGVKTIEEDMLGHRKLQIETRLKLLAKWSRKYGDKLTQEVTGPNGGPVQHEHTEKLSEPLERALAALAEGAEETSAPPALPH